MGRELFDVLVEIEGIVLHVGDCHWRECFDFHSGFGGIGTGDVDFSYDVVECVSFRTIKREDFFGNLFNCKAPVVVDFRKTVIDRHFIEIPVIINAMLLVQVAFLLRKWDVF